MGSLGLVGYNAPSEQFLSWGAPLSIALGGLLGASFLRIFYPGSVILKNIWLYGGMVTFCAFMLFDTQNMLLEAKTERNYDPIKHSLEIYLNAISIFTRVYRMLGESKKE